VADVGSDLSPATGPIAAAPPAAGEAPPAPPADFSNSAGAPPQTLEDWLTCWSTVVEAVNRRDPMLAGVLRSCRPVEGGPSRLVIGAPYGFHLERLQDVQKAPLLDEAVADVAGPGCAVEAVFSGAEARSSPAAGPDDLD